MKKTPGRLTSNKHQVILTDNEQRLKDDGGNM